MEKRTRKSSNSNANGRREGAAQTIRGFCEREFCGTLKTVFLGEGNLAFQDSLGLGAYNGNGNGDDHGGGGGSVIVGRRSGLVQSWLEVWDYVGGALFRGFVAKRLGQSGLFVFFDNGIVGRDLKPGIMALLELCSLPETECSQLVVCLDRRFAASETRTMMRDLGWVGFEPITLDDWADGGETLSDKWIFLGMET